MRSFLVVLILVAGCSKKEEEPEPEPTKVEAPVPVDAEPPPTEIEGIPVAVALPATHKSIYGFAMDAERLVILTTDVFWAPKSGGTPKLLIEVGTDDDTATDLVTPTNEEQVRRMTADRPEVAAAMRGARVVEFAKSYRYGAVHGGYLYLSNDGTAARRHDDTSIERLPVGGGAIEVLAKGHPTPSAFHVDDSGMYVVTHDRAILKFPLTGGDATTLYPAPKSSEKTHPYHVVLGGDNFFISESTLHEDFAHKRATITRVPKSGGAPKVILAKLPASVYGLVADATSLYWTDGKQLGMYRTDHAGKAKPKLVIKGNGKDMRVHGKYLYRNVDDYLVRAPITGGAEEKLRKLPDFTDIVGIDDTAVWLAKDRYILRHDLR